MTPRTRKNLQEVAHGLLLRLTLFLLTSYGVAGILIVGQAIKHSLTSKPHTHVTSR